MAGDVDDKTEKEIEAIRTLLGTLRPLEPQTRGIVLAYVMQSLQIAFEFHDGPYEAEPSVAEQPRDQADTAKQPLTHIKQLKDGKKPRSANEMAALVAFYLENVAPEKERKDRINSKDIDTYFKIAGFRLPEQSRVTLGNARNAGYFDAVGSGEYKLNAIGYNLVAHSMPRGTGKVLSRTSKKRPAKASSKKKK